MIHLRKLLLPPPPANTSSAPTPIVQAPDSQSSVKNEQAAPATASTENNEPAAPTDKKSSLMDAYLDFAWKKALKHLEDLQSDPHRVMPHMSEAEKRQVAKRMVFERLKDMKGLCRSMS